MDAAACSPAGPAWWCQAIRHRRTLRWCRFLRPRGREVDPIIRTTGLDRNPCVFLSRKVSVHQPDRLSLSVGPACG